MPNKLRAIKADITTLKVDAIVNAANPYLIGGGGVNGAIHQAAGPQLLKEGKSIGSCPPGEARITKGYQLPARFVIHAVGPIWEGGKNGEYKILESCYQEAIRLAKENGVETIAFPSISTGIYGFPIEFASRVAINTIEYVTRRDNTIKEVIFCCFSDEDLEVYQRALQQKELEDQQLDAVLQSLDSTESEEEPQFIEATREELQAIIKSLWEMAHRYAELAERPAKPEDHFLRWRQIRFMAAKVVRMAGQMDADTFSKELSLRIDTFSWAVGGVSFTTEPPKTE